MRGILLTSFAPVVFQYLIYQSLTMVNERHKNCFNCKTTNLNNPERFCIIAPNDNVYSRYIRFDRLYDSFFRNLFMDNDCVVFFLFF